MQYCSRQECDVCAELPPLDHGFDHVLDDMGPILDVRGHDETRIEADYQVAGYLVTYAG